MIRGAIAEHEAHQIEGAMSLVEHISSDATPAEVMVLELPTYTAGILEYEVLAIDPDGDAITGRHTIRWVKKATLTLGTQDDISAFVTDMGGGSYQVIDSGDNLAIELTGIAATDISWRVLAKLTMIGLIVTP